MTSPGSPRPQAESQPTSIDQLNTARAAKWHQSGEPLLTFEAMRDWLNASGLVLYSSRAQQLPSPAPSCVEATLGKLSTDPVADETVAARRLLARLISEGAAVPLNLLGVTGAAGTDMPDFVASPAVFSYIFTLRGNKAWKQSPVTSGPIKVSPLALATYEILAAKVTMSAYDLATQLGKEVTEAAVLRALTELWSQLRVLPVPQEEGTATLWELATSRFTKQIKAGANAGQPSALSALISLYLGQAIAATEDQIETFLSPLAPRSRLREVIHALLAARQLETLVIDGKTLLHVAGDLPAFAPTPVVQASESEEPASGEAEGDGSRIRKFTPKPGGKIGTGLRAKPSFGKSFADRGGARGAKPGFSRPAGGDRERRPFSPRPAAPRFDKPWEDRPVLPPAAAPEGSAMDASAATPAARPFSPSSRPREDRGGFAGKPRFDSRRDDSRVSSDSRPPRKTFSKPGTFGRKREGFSGKPAFGGSDRGDSRPPRREFTPRTEGTGRPDRPSFGDRPARPAFGDRPQRSDRPASGGFKRPGSYAPRPERSSFGGPREDRGPRPEGAGGGFGARKPFTPRAGGDRPPFRTKPAFGGDRPSRPSFPPRNQDSGAAGEAPRKTFRKFDAPRGPKPFGAKPFGGPRSSSQGSERPARPFPSDRPSRPLQSDRPSRPYQAERSDRPAAPRGEGRPSFGAKKPFSKSAAFAGKGGPFAKFAGGKKPFRKPGPGTGGGGKPAGGGFAPVKRRRPEEGDQA